MYSPRWLFLYPALLLLGVGIGGMIWLIPGAQSIGSVTFDIHTLLLSGVAVMLGFNMLLFSLLSQRSSSIHGLLPRDARFEKLLHVITLERLLVAGGLLTLLGIWGFSIAW